MATPQLALDREVLIIIDDMGTTLSVDKETFRVSKGKHQVVRWETRSGADFEVDFETNGSPFYETQFNQDEPYSSLVRRNVLVSPKIYKYTVRVAGKPDLDPGGGVVR